MIIKRHVQLCHGYITMHLESIADHITDDINVSKIGQNFELMQLD